MPSHTILTPDQIAAFRRDGFVIARGFFGPREIAAIAAWADEVRGWPERAGHHMVYYEDSQSGPPGRIVQRIEDLTPFHDGFRDLFTQGRLPGAVADLAAEPAILFKDKINLKLAGGDGFKAHQDQQAGWGLYAPYFITGLVSIDAATEANGCLELAAGWHDRGLIGHEWAPLTEAETADMAFVSCPTAPGDAVFFDSYTPHRSGPNTTGSARRVLYATYNRASDGDHSRRYFADKRASFPPDIERATGETYVFRV